jgi:hypothetical protein
MTIKAIGFHFIDEFFQLSGDNEIIFVDRKAPDIYLLNSSDPQVFKHLWVLKELSGFQIALARKPDAEGRALFIYDRVHDAACSILWELMVSGDRTFPIEFISPMVEYLLSLENEPTLTYAQRLVAAAAKVFSETGYQPAETETFHWKDNDMLSAVIEAAGQA